MFPASTSPVTAEQIFLQMFSSWCLSTADSTQGGKGQTVDSQHFQKHKLLQGNIFWLGNARYELFSGFSHLSFQFWNLYFSKGPILLTN